MALLLAFCASSAKAETIRGDVNKDGSVTIADVTMLVNIILGKQTDYESAVADVNKDGSITKADVTTLVNIILGKGDTETGEFSDDPATGPANAPRKRP